MMKSISKQEQLHYILRIAIAMCFIGHGMFGIITKAIWCNYFAVFGIGKTMAYQLMPVVGVVDVLLGVVMLIRPVRAIAAWLVLWGLMTATLRPLSGEPVAELIERAGNFGAPFIFLLLSGIPGNVKGWFTKVAPNDNASVNWQQVMKGLQVASFLLLLGHGWLNLIEKKGLLNQYNSIGFYNATEVAHIIGSVEIIGAVFILIKPVRNIILFLFAWKMLSETLYPNHLLFEWVERGGSYGCLLALYVIAAKYHVQRTNVVLQ